MIEPRRFTGAAYLLPFCALIIYLIGNASVPLWDRDEPRYAQCSRQMLESGDWVVPHLYDDLRRAKPPITYWCQATAMSFFGVDAPPNELAFAARLPSGIAMALVLLMVGIAFRREFDSERAFWSVLVLATCMMTIVSAKSCLTDAILLVFITAGQFCVYRIWQGRGTWPVILVLGLADGLALMTKGPVVFGIHLMTLVGIAFLNWSFCWTRAHVKLVLIGVAIIAAESFLPDIPWPKFTLFGKVISLSEMVWPMFAVQGLTVIVLALVNRRLPTNPSPELPQTPMRPAIHWPSIAAKSLAVLGLIVGVGLPWAILLEQRSPGFLHTMIWHEVGDRATTGLEGHKGPFGYYLAAIWPLFLPWSLLLPAALVLGWKRRTLPHIRFALAAVLGPWLMFEEVQTKLPHYFLPCYVPLALLAAEAIVQCLRHGATAFSDKAFLRGAIIWGAIFSVLGILPFFAARWFTPLPWAAMAVVAACAISYAAIVVTLFMRQRVRRAITTIGIGAFVVYAVIFRIYLPQCQFLQLSVQAADVLKGHGAVGREHAVMLDYKEPSLAFYQGGTIREHSNMAITPALLAGNTPAAERPAKREQLAKLNQKFTELPEWAVITREVWEASKPKKAGQPDPRDHLEVIATFRGLDVADGMRNVEVMVVRRK